MRYEVNINGIDVDATYSEENIRDVFAPLIMRLADMKRAKDGRILVMLAAPPGAGKSTLVSFLEHYAKELCPEMTVQAIGMDGFHRRQEYLLSHETEVEGEMMPMVRIKGAPITFDLEAFSSKIAQVAAGETCGWPAYDRHLHNPIEDAILVTGDIVILEGNYLLLDEEGWRDLRKMADYTVFLRADEQMLRRRLVDRKEASGNSREKAEEFVDFSDMRNVRLCLEHSMPADLELSVDAAGGFKQEKERSNMKKALKIILISVVIICAAAALVACVALIRLNSKTASIQDDYSAVYSDTKYKTPVQATGVEVITQDVSCGYAVIEMFSAWNGGNITEETLYDEYGKVVTSTGKSFADEMNKQFPEYKTELRKWMKNTEVIDIIYDNLSRGIPVPIEWAALYGEEWTLHYSLVTALDVPNDRITVANPYGYMEELTLEEFLNRTSFEAYERMPIFFKLGFAMGIFEKNAVFSIK